MVSWCMRQGPNLHCCPAADVQDTAQFWMHSKSLPRLIQQPTLKSPSQPARACRMVMQQTASLPMATQMDTALMAVLPVQMGMMLMLTARKRMVKRQSTLQPMDTPMDMTQAAKAQSRSSLQPATAMVERYLLDGMQHCPAQRCCCNVLQRPQAGTCLHVCTSMSLL